jgi:predicted Zn-dependent peptidase
MVFVGVGDLDHDSLVSTVEKNFASIPSTSSVPITAAPAIFTGSDYRHRLDEMPDVSFAYAFPYAGVRDPHFHAFGVIGAMIGHYQFGNIHAQYAPSPLVQLVSQDKICKTLKPINMAYSDVGLFGVLAVSDPYKLFVLGRAIARHLTSYVYDADPVYFEWAKKAYLTDLLSHYKTTGIADLLGVDYLHHERVIHPAEVAARVQAVTIEDVRSAAEETFYDNDFALSAFGNVHELPAYQDLRVLTYNKAF